ncbi:MAG: putative reverse transcriptase, partial [Streblomastix strix]
GGAKKWAREWENLGLAHITKGLQIPWGSLGPLSGKGLNICTYTKADAASLHKILVDGIQKQIFVQAKAKFYSPMFLVPISDGKDRFILNVKMLNKHIAQIPFKMENHTVVAQTLWKGSWLIKFDLTEAYSHIPISEIDQQYLGFEAFGNSFRYMTLPFGITCAPAIFTKLMRPKLAKIRSFAQTVIYMDDGLIISPTFEEAKNSTVRTLQILQALDLTINFNKSQLIPTQKLDFFGWEWETQEMSVKLSQLRHQEALSLVKSWLKLYNTNMVSIKNLARLIGVLQLRKAKIVSYRLIAHGSKTFNGGWKIFRGQLREALPSFSRAFEQLQMQVLLDGITPSSTAT